MKHGIPLALTVLLASACGGLDGGSRDVSLDGEGSHCSAVRSRTINTGPLPDGCVKMEGGDLGREGLELTAGSVTVTLTDWVSKDGESGEYVGFSWSANGGTPFFSIKAGGESHIADENGVWTHPAGTWGPEASAISNIVVCDGDPADEGDPTDENHPGDPLDGSGSGDPDDPSSGGDCPDDPGTSGDPDDGDPNGGDGDLDEGNGGDGSGTPTGGEGGDGDTPTGDGGDLDEGNGGDGGGEASPGEMGSPCNITTECNAPLVCSSEGFCEPSV